MNNKSSKSILEIYGLIRMLSGIAQIVGMSAGYFILEFIGKYPENFNRFVIDRESLFLMYLAVFIRSLFHIASGVGIARIQNWARILLIWGWPIMMIINFGLLHTLSQDWQMYGLSHSLVEVMSWPKLIVYLGVVAFDYSFISSCILRLNREEKLNNKGGRIERKKIAILFFIIILFFSLLLFMGRPIKGGFYKGFYKSRGKVSAQSGKLTKVLKAKRSQERKEFLGATRTKKGLAEQAQAKSQIEELKVDQSQAAGKENLVQEQLRKSKKESGLPYSKIVGVLAGLCLIIGFLYQILEIHQAQKAQNVSLSCFLFLSVGFFLMTIYAFNLKIFLLLFPSLVSLVLCVSIMAMKYKES